MVIRYNGIEIDREALTIRHRGELYDAASRNCSGRRGGRTGEKVLFPTFQHLILAGGLSVGQLFDLVYGHLEDGGPDTGPNMFWPAMAGWEPTYRALKLVLQGERRNSLMHYRLVPEPV